MQYYLAQAGDWVTVIQGAIFVVIVLAFRKGIVGEVAERWRSWRQPKGATASP
jgi:branched-chain amino acid transport system permease protein